MDGTQHTLALTLSYHGAPFSGFARQEGLLTVQGSVEEALHTLFRREVPTVGAGRTDAGVHARAQVMTFDVTTDELDSRSIASLKRSLNALTHEAIAVRSVEEKPAGFSARFDAKAREYHYHLDCGDAPLLFMRDFAWHVGCPLDVPAMYEASRALIGEHDFKSFCVTASAIGKPTHRNVASIELVPEVIFGEEVLTVVIKGNAFLHSMVRTIVGSLVLVGKGKRPASWMAEVLQACDRQAAGETAPAKGLVFWEVTY